MREPRGWTSSGSDLMLGVCRESLTALITASTESRLSSRVYFVLPLGVAATRSFRRSWYLVSLWTGLRM